MDNKITEQIKGLYDKEPEKYVINKRHSTPHTKVFTRPSKPYSWLTISQKDKDTYTATRTDTTGFITHRDTYKAENDTIKCTNKENYKPKERTSLKQKLELARGRTENTNPTQHMQKDKGDNQR
jgi:glucan-binding YG repeat protein